jgi:Patatin-like phospholipase
MGRIRAWIDRHTLIRRIVYFFPVQLVLVQVKKNPVLFLFWILLFGFVTGKIASKYGVSLLFMDPEYLGSVSPLSYFIIGFACGGYIMAYQISCYVHNAFRFPFLATCSRPFLRFSTNNFIIPSTFLITYLILITRFLLHEPVSKFEIVLDLLAFLCGNLFFTLVSIIYFFRKKRNQNSLYVKQGDEKPKQRTRRIVLNRDPIKNKLQWKTITPGKEGRDWHVESYISSLLRIRRTRPFEHYDKSLINQVFRRNHKKAVRFEIIVILTLVVLGFFREYQFFIIPAGACIFLLFTMYLMLTTVLRTWFRGWTNLVLVFLLLLVNWMHQFNFMHAQTRAYGINYTNAAAIYSNEEIDRYANDQKALREDSLNTISILENWKRKNTTDSTHKPKMVIVACSGGGLRSALWTLYTMQYLDSVSQGKLMPRTSLICGSSGGMLGAAFIREAWLREQKSENIRHNDIQLRDQLGADILNPMAVSLVVNDLFVPMRMDEYAGVRYSSNRAFAFENQFHKNTHHILEKTIFDYREPEKQAIIPMMILAPTIANDGRKLLIASQGISYLTKPANKNSVHYQPLCDAIEFRRFFEKQNADSLRFSSALRMNATFPYITPLTTLPTKPQIEVFDAGMRDNYGIENILRFMHQFRNWIAANTSGVIIVQTRDKAKVKSIEATGGQTMTQSFSKPLTSFYANLFTVQNYNQDERLAEAAHWFPGQIDLLEFELKNSEPDVISLSWHLTSREKARVFSSMEEKTNKDAADLFKRLIREEIPSPVMKASAAEN